MPKTDKPMAGTMRVAVAVSGAALALAGLTTGASAAPVAVQSIPTCVKLTEGETTKTPVRSYANVRSSCLGTYRMRFIWAWADDGECFTLEPGGYHGESKLGRAAYVSELREC
ncbi:hypothetical protein ACWGE0_06475 [Lentzea sp. NPDC054927]